MEGPGQRIGIDIGGTFTDAVIVAFDGSLQVAKVRSTPGRHAAGFMDGLRLLLERAAIGPAAVGYVAHGSTVATNALVERRLARTALVTNQGFGDVLAIGTQMRAQVYDLWTPEPTPIVPRSLCVQVRGRLGANGEIFEELDDASVRTAAARLRDERVEAIAVMLLHSFTNPAHERRVAAILAEELPGVPVTLSIDVAPEFREYVRASTTALNASLLPLMRSYVDEIGAELATAAVTVPLHLMQSNGGVAPAERARSLPIALAASGPAAGVIGGAQLAALVGERDVLTFDMGGTTADIGLVIDGQPQLRFAGEAAGMPINTPQIDVLCIGAGGGSIASVDEFGSLRVGPESAGAEPGPAAYGHGGLRATVTDAHVVLGTLAAGVRLAGQVPLDRESACAAVGRDVAEPLGLSVEGAAHAILRIANANMASALRVMSVARGHDPRQFALVAIGGAGPMHACALADEIGIPRVVVPRYPGVGAALGLLATNIRHDLRRSFLRPTAAVTPAELDAELERLELEASTLLASSTAVAESTVIRFELDMRYRGQAYNLTVPLAERPVTTATLEAAEVVFADEHRRLYDYTPEITATDIVTVRATAIAITPPLTWPHTLTTGRSAPKPRMVFEDRSLQYRSVVRSELAIGDLIVERTIVDQDDTTTVVPSGWSGRIGASGTIVLERELPQ